MKRFQTLLFVVAAVAVALAAMLVLGVGLGAEDNSSSPGSPLAPSDEPHPSLDARG
jgi:hypothetical protein